VQRLEHPSRIVKPPRHLRFRAHNHPTV